MMDVTRVAVGSMNKAKLKAARDVVLQIWPDAVCRGVSVDSGISAMPMCDLEAREGAMNRAIAAKDALVADMGLGMEGSVSEEGGAMYLTGWVAVACSSGQVSLASCGRLPLPESVAERVRAGEELGPIIDELSGQQHSRESLGAVGFLTDGLVPRDMIFSVALAYAMAPIRHPELYDA